MLVRFRLALDNVVFANTINDIIIVIIIDQGRHALTVVLLTVERAALVQTL